MNVSVRIPTMSRDEFLTWVQVQNERHEFDGFQPVLMTGGGFNHSRIVSNIMYALRKRLMDGPCFPLSDAGVATIGDAIRYPDVLVTCAKAPGQALVIPGVVVVFEVLSPSSGRIDRIDKAIEYAAVPTIMDYVIVERTGMGLTSLARTNADEPFVLKPLTGADILRLPAIGIEIPVRELYEDIEF